jgi:hypothetical protein
VATTVIFNSPLYSSLIVAQNIILASESTDSVIIFAASSTSNIDKSVQPVILNNNHLAQAIDNSSKGESIADLAASVDLFSPDQ